ncbi:MAG: cadherin domain-containing protein [Sulfurovum sp.]|nr:cadherin domain-containing protein [Sulfurovaceae bacterium]
MNYWLSSGLSLEEIAQSFSEQDETKLKYPNGFDYWNKELENNSISRSLFILAIINGAKGDDADLLANQLTVGLKFAEAKTILINVTKNVESVSPVLCNHTLVTDGCGVTKEEEIKTPEITPKEEEKKVEEDIVVPIIIVPTPIIPSTPSNNIPTATAQSITVDEDTSNNPITLAGTDGDTLSFIVETQPTHGTLDISALPIVKYTPTADYFGSDSFTFKVNDGTVDSSSATVTITVTDVAEPNNAPTLSNTTLSIDENATNPTVVGKVLVDNNGSSNIVNYELNDTTNFTISVSGIISTASTLDYESKDSYSLEVNATNGEVSDNVIVTININNIGEVIPILTDTLLNIDENTTFDSVIGMLTINNIGDTNITSFDTNTTIFDINITGHITIKSQVDYETKDFYYLSATATNQAGTSNSVDLNISIGDDTNDLFINSAVFDDNSTTDESDDKLNIYFTKDIDGGPVSTDNFTIYGDGVIVGLIIKLV